MVSSEAGKEALDMNMLSKSQKVVYDMEKYAGGSIAVICGSLLIEGTRSQAELTAAINGLYRLNPALRTCITETDGGAVHDAFCQVQCSFYGRKT